MTAPIVDPLDVLGPGADPAVGRALVVALGRLLTGDLAAARVEALALVVSPEAARLVNADLLAAELGRESLGRVARLVTRTRVAPGVLRLVLLGDDAPAVRALDVGALRARIAAVAATGGPNT